MSHCTSHIQTVRKLLAKEVELRESLSNDISDIHKEKAKMVTKWGEEVGSLSSRAQDAEAKAADALSRADEAESV